MHGRSVLQEMLPGRTHDQTVHQIFESLSLPRGEKIHHLTIFRQTGRKLERCIQLFKVYPDRCSKVYHFTILRRTLEDWKVGALPTPGSRDTVLPTQRVRRLRTQRLPSSPCIPSLYRGMLYCRRNCPAEHGRGCTQRLKPLPLWCCRQKWTESLS